MSNAVGDNERIKVGQAVFNKFSNLDKRDGVTFGTCPHGKGVWLDAQVIGGVFPAEELFVGFHMAHRFILEQRLLAGRVPKCPGPHKSKSLDAD
jgi:hypothetical protein